MKVSRNCILIIILSLFSNLTYSAKSEKNHLEKNNQTELQKVIDHYSKNNSDSLKLKAATFLIENMDEHYSWKNKSFDEFCQNIASISTNIYNGRSVIESYDSVFLAYQSKLINFEMVEDIDTLRNKYLINNIDSAFIAWKSPFAKQLTFEQFCEYLLPYRIGDEKIESWRSYYSKQYVKKILKTKKRDIDSISSIDICELLKKNMCKQ